MKKIGLIVAFLLAGYLGSAQVYRISTVGESKQFVVEDTINGTRERPYLNREVLADTTSQGRINIYRQLSVDYLKPIGFPSPKGHPYTAFLDGNNSDATFESAAAVLTWFADNTGFNSAGRSASSTEINVKSYGAKGDNVTDDTSAIQAAIDYAETQTGQSKGNVTIFFPEGSFVIGGAGIVISQSEIRIKGVDVYTTRLKFVPTEDGQTCVKFTKESGLHYHNGISNMTIRTTNTTYNKTALSVKDGSNFRCENVHITGFKGSGTNSVGIETFGRQGYTFSDISIFDTSNPIYLRKNPNTTQGYLSVDHFNFHNLFVESLDNTNESLVSAIILIENGSHISHLSFTGYQAWVAADYGLYWVNDGTSGNEVFSPSTNIYIENLRRENNTDINGTSVYIKLYSNRWLNNLTIMNSQLDAGQHGIDLDYVHHTTLIGTELLQDNVGTTRVAVQYPASSSTVRSKTLNIIGCEFDQDALLSTGSLQRQFGTSNLSGWGVPSTALYAFQRLDNTPSQHPTHAMGGLHEWSFAQEMVNNGTFILPVRDNEDVAVARIEVTAATATGIESGVWIASNQNNAGTNGITLLSGSANTAVTDTGVNLCVYSTAANIDGTTIVKNRLGANAWVICKVYMKKTTEK